MIIKDRKWMLTAVAAIFSLVSFNAVAVEIDNGLATNQQGYWRVDVTDGGESRAVWMTGTGTPSGTIFENVEIVYDYFSYVDTGSGGVRLSDTDILVEAILTVPGTVSSTGTFTGSGGNTIDWVMLSSIEPGGVVMVSELSFAARTGTLGTLDFYQYLDEDVLGSGDDVFFTRGTSGTDLELFTIDNEEALGVSHSGAQSASQGLLDADFTGWAACEYNLMKPAITAGTQSVSPGGVMCASLSAVEITHPIVGQSYGPIDVVSVVSWVVDPDATAASIITTLGGVPDITDVIDPPPVVDIDVIPVPGLNNWMLALLALLLGAMALRIIQRRRSMH